MPRELKEYVEDKVLAHWLEWRAAGKGAKAYIREKHASPGKLYEYLRKWRANLADNKHPMTGEPMDPAEAADMLGKVGRHQEDQIAIAKAKGPLPPLNGMDAKAYDKDSLRQLKQEARDLLQRSLRKRIDPSQIQSAKAIMAIKEEAEDRVPNPYAGLAVEELVDRLLTTCVSMVGVKSVYRRLEWLNLRGEAEVVGEVSEFRPTGATPVEESQP